METITRKWRGKRVSFDILTQEEADAQKLPYKPWRLAPPGTLALTDDKYVVDCLSVNQFRDRTSKLRTFKTFSIARQFVAAGARLLWGERRGQTDFSGIKPTSWQRSEARKTRTKNTVSVYAQMLLAGNVDWHKLGLVYRKDVQIPEATVKRLIKQPEIQEMVKEEVRKACSKLGVTEETVVGILLSSVKVAEGAADANAMIKAAAELKELLDMTPERAGRTMPTMLGFSVTKEIEASMTGGLAEFPEDKKLTEGAIHVEPEEGGGASKPAPGSDCDEAPVRAKGDGPVEGTAPEHAAQPA